MVLPFFLPDVNTGDTSQTVRKKSTHVHKQKSNSPKQNKNIDGRRLKHPNVCLVIVSERLTFVQSSHRCQDLPSLPVCPGIFFIRNVNFSLRPITYELLATWFEVGTDVLIMQMLRQDSSFCVSHNKSIITISIHSLSILLLTRTNYKRQHRISLALVSFHVCWTSEVDVSFLPLREYFKHICE